MSRDSWPHGDPGGEAGAEQRPVCALGSSRLCPCAGFARQTRHRDHVERRQSPRTEETKPPTCHQGPVQLSASGIKRRSHTLPPTSLRVCPRERARRGGQNPCVVLSGGRGGRRWTEEGSTRGQNRGPAEGWQRGRGQTTVSQPWAGHAPTPPRTERACTPGRSLVLLTGLTVLVPSGHPDDSWLLSGFCSVR